MADDKKPASGGSEWGTFEIILGLLLVIALLDRLSGNNRIGKPTAANTPDNTPAYVQNFDDATCGLSIERPLPQERLSGFITIVGKTEGCNWPFERGVVLYAQVVDSKGKPVSAYTAVTPSAISGETISFATTISITTAPAKGTGYLILLPATQPKSNYTLSTRIPIRF